MSRTEDLIILLIGINDYLGKPTNIELQYSIIENTREFTKIRHVFLLI